MKATLYIPYEGADAETLDGVYEDPNEYIEALNREFEKGNTEEFAALFGGTSSNMDASKAFYGTDGSMYKVPTVEKEDTVYAPCPCEVIAEDGSMEDIDKMIDHFAKQELFIDTFVMNGDEMSEEFIEEYNGWVGSHRRLEAHAAKKKLGGEWVWLNEPIRELRLVFKDHKGNDLFAELHGCKVVDELSFGRVVIYVESMTLIDDWRKSKK